ncbi:LysR substrate-binding domain-containing protein [Falsiroseomonas sp. HW251]|uniref:LysR substrate-binding domain-containing protein n=1 Tax=Falsiroseomonas sp. HW251 TaxID=3390998 RepID=UPI003D313BAE
MNLRQMQVFHAIMTHGSVTDAARALDVAQPSVSAVLKHAEQTLGAKLFARIGGRLVPTPEAEMLFPEVQRIYAQLDRIELFARDLRTGGSGRLALIGNPTLVSNLVPPAIARFRDAYPTARIRLQTAVFSGEMADRVIRREFDLGLGYGPNQDLHSGTEVIGRSRIGVALQCSHRLAHRKRIAARDLAEEALITFGAGSPIRLLAEAVFADAGCELRPAIEASFSAAGCALARQGAGLAIVDMLVAREVAGDDLVLIPLDTDRRAEFRLIHPENRAPSVLAETFAAMLRDAAQAHEKAFP